MLRTINLLLVALMLGGAAVVYDLKYEAERATNKVAKITRKIENERDAIATLKAEWSLLNQPKRLQDLTERYKSYLELDPLDPTQIGTLDDVPFKPAVSTDSRPPALKGSIKLAQPEKASDKTATIGKFLDRLPSGKASGGPTTTGSVPKASPSAPMQLVPKTIVTKPAETPAKPTR